MTTNPDAQARQFNYGGQAVIEGVMMRGSRNLAVAVRNPEGVVVVKEEEIKSPLYNGIWSRIPFIRGLGMLWDSLGLGTKALTWSADVAVGEEESFQGPVAWGTIALSLLLGVGLFFLLPTGAAAGIQRWLGLESSILVNGIEGLIQLTLVIGYIILIGRMEDVKRLWRYHGAEHKTINAYEAGAELTPESVARFPLEHPRCGTGFLLVVVFISVLLFSLLGRPPLPLLFLSRVVLIPVIAGISYEYIRLMARHIDNPLVKVLIQPQLWLQRLTTAEPDASMLEVAITAFNRVLAMEKPELAPAAAVPVLEAAAAMPEK